MGATWNKITGYSLVFGAACAAPSVDALNAFSAIAAGRLLLKAAPLVVMPASAIGDRLQDKFNMKARPGHYMNKIMKAGLLSGAAILSGVAGYNIYDDIQNNNQEFAHTFNNNVTMPVYNTGRSAVTNIVVPVGKTITRGLNGFIESATGYDMPVMNVEPAFTAQSSLRARCLEPGAYILLDGTIAALDQNITGRERTQNAQRAIDILSGKKTAGTLCFGN